MVVTAFGRLALAIAGKILQEEFHFTNEVMGWILAMRRANLYAGAGADMVMLFPNTEGGAKSTSRSECAQDFRQQRRTLAPIFLIWELEAMGYKMVNDAISAITTMFKSVKDLFVRLKETSCTEMD